MRVRQRRPEKEGEEEEDEEEEEGRRSQINDDLRLAGWGIDQQLTNEERDHFGGGFCSSPPVSPVLTKLYLLADVFVRDDGLSSSASSSSSSSSSPSS